MFDWRRWCRWLAAATLAAALVSACGKSIKDTRGHAADAAASQVDGGRRGAPPPPKTPADAGASRNSREDASVTSDAGTSTGGSSGSRASGTGGSGGAAAPGDFAARCGAPGVVRCVGFDAAEDIAGKSGGPTGILSGAATPMLDTQVKASGASSLKFTVPANSAADSSGSYFANFSDDYSVQFDSGQGFYVQWRQRFAPDFITTKYAGGGGWKQVIIGEGSRPGNPAYSCTTLEVVVVNGYYRGFPGMYHSCGVKDGQYEGFEQPIPPDDFALQNAIAGCTYHNQKVPPCVGYAADQWMTFQVHIQVGTWYKNDRVYRHDSTIQLWVAGEGKPSELVIDLSPGDPACAAEQSSQPSCHTGYDLVNDAIGTAKYGQIWLLPYNTGKDSSVAQAETYTWYDELIVSRMRIADPVP